MPLATRVERGMASKLGAHFYRFVGLRLNHDLGFASANYNEATAARP